MIEDITLLYNRNFFPYVQHVLLQELFETTIEFMKLEKIELGGIKGKMLSAQVVQIFDEFNELFKVFAESSYDPMDICDDVSIKSIL